VDSRPCLTAALSATLLLACGDDTVVALSDASTDQTTVDVTFFDVGDFGVEAGNGDGPVMPAPPPPLGAQIDRVGRPGINLALDHVFDTTASAGAAKNAYNADANPSHWSSYVPEIARNLAVYDALDGTCGNQLGYGAFGTPAYSALATMLAADALWVDTDAATCTQYLAVERTALGQAMADCGGWTPLEDAMYVTYNALAGTLSAAMPPGPLTNGITTPSSPPSDAFPYLAVPH
jgi:hypothetical protein